MGHLPAKPATDDMRAPSCATGRAHMGRVTAEVVVLVVGFGNAQDVVGCMRALASATPEPTFEVFITENGGALAMDALIRALRGDGTQCQVAPADEIPVRPQHAVQEQRLRWCRPDGSVRMWINVAEASENLGYAGGVNAWLRPLLTAAGWRGAWILNPDAEPEPAALAELVACSSERQKGMVGSRLQPFAGSDCIHSRGLAWQKLTARTEAVDYHAPCRRPADLADVERRLDSPSGASLFVTRAMIEAIGLMDERYFLYFEDLDWGLRAKRHGGIGYAHASVVPHRGGSTTRSRRDGRGPSRLTVYLEFRNRVLFVRSRFPGWLPWTVTMQVLHALSFAVGGSFGLMGAAFRGLGAGIRGETGRPDGLIRAPRLASHDVVGKGYSAQPARGGRAVADR